jgi:scyllo-inositol 2-dehydrogenase (NADP+)
MHIKRFNWLVLTIAVIALVLCFSSLPAAAAVQTDLLKVGVARVTHGHVWDVIEANKRGQVKVVGIYEPDQQLAEKYTGQFGIDPRQVFSDLAEMIEQTHPEAVAAYGSIYEHLGVVEACAPAGVHVMVEKPLAYSMEHGRKIGELAAKHGIQVVTNYATSWFPSFHAAYDVVHEQKQVGEIRKVVIHDGHMGPREIGCSEEFLEWLTDPVQNGGGALIDFGCYGASLMTWLMDGAVPASVTAVTQQIKPDIYP